MEGVLAAARVCVIVHVITESGIYRKLYAVQFCTQPVYSFTCFKL